MFPERLRSYFIGPLSVAMTGRVSLGVDNETLDMSGALQEFNTPIVTNTPGVTGGLRPLTQGSNGIFAQPSLPRAPRVDP
jgi:hypothetical protein